MSLSPPSRWSGLKLVTLAALIGTNAVSTLAVEWIEIRWKISIRYYITVSTLAVEWIEI